MRLVTCLYENKERVGALTEEGVVFLPYPDMNTLIETLSPAALALTSTAKPVPLEDVQLLAPIPRPRQDVLCLGMNYRDHAKEAATYDAEAFTKEKPIAVYFSKRVSRAGDPDGEIPRYEGLVERLDYEAELAVIIGKTAKNVKAEEAGEYVFGYTVLNDVSARDLQTGHKQWYFGKSLDGFTPMGPCILTADETAFPPTLDISCAVNGEERQRSNTSLLVHGIPEVIQELSAGMTLLPGTIIATGTPAGVGMGRTPPEFLKQGDVVECTVQHIGSLRSTVG
ncbi:MAG: fumarylacetoacetate hydrolase family protein [Oscillibacter sp.]|nr:fumarylacetoacetate hydrolase family protein [Oscillibacter sp.]